MDGHSGAGREQGFTLLEVLITVLVLSLGLLGLAALQVASIRDTQGAYLKAQAVNGAYQIIDAMRANRDDALDGDYDDGFGAGVDSYCVEDPAAVASDLCDWERTLDGALPNGQGAVDVDGNGVATICVRWTEPRRSAEIASGQCSAVDDGDPDDNVQLFELQTVL